MKVYGFCGLARAGKTTAASWLVEELAKSNPLPVIRASFAGPIRRGLKELGVIKEDHPHLYRELAQLLGARCRAEDGHWWLSQMTKTLDNADSINAQAVVIDDLRYTNELASLTGVGAEIILIDGSVRVPWLHDGVYRHESEEMAVIFSEQLNRGHESQVLDRVDYIIDANGSMEEYRANFDNWLTNRSMK